MLVLSRMTGQEIVIRGDIIIRVSRISPTKVYIGIVAPPDVTVHRREVHDRITKEEHNDRKPVR